MATQAKNKKKIVSKKQPVNQASSGNFDDDVRFDKEEASILTDLIRQYVGTAMPAPSPNSGVFLNQDRVLLTQTYLDLAGFDLYDEVEQDPHIEAIMKTLKYSVAGLGYRVEPASDSPEDIEKAQFVEEFMEGMEGLLQDFVAMLDSIGKGFSVMEIIWGANEDGNVIPIKLMNRPQRRFQFDATTRALKLRKMTNAFYGDPLPDKKFIVHRDSQKYENPFGEAMDAKLYWVWLFKRNVTKYWMRFLESNAAPIPIVQHPANANQDLKNEAMDIAKKIRNASHGRIPENFTILWAERIGAAAIGSAYQDFIRYANDEATKCVLGEVLTTEGAASGGVGSKAGASESRIVMQSRITYYAKNLAVTLNSTLIQWAIDFNYTNTKKYPRIVFLSSESKDVEKICRAIKSLKDSGWKATKEYVEKNTGIELEEAAEPVVQPGQPGDPKKEPVANE